MEDCKILDLFFAREEMAIQATAQKYGNYCYAISANILHSREDAEECVNDTYLRAWDAIPPKRPTAFRVFLGKITRNLSLDKYKWKNRKKRAADETAQLFSELDECIPGGIGADAEYEAAQVEGVINASLHSMSKDARIVFIRRYFHAESISDIAARFSMGESKVKSMLFRARKKLKVDLEKEGVFT